MYYHDSLVSYLSQFRFCRLTARCSLVPQVFNRKSMSIGISAKKKVKTGANLYVPSGRSPKKYKARRAKERADREKKAKGKSASKAFKFLDFD
jgi:hypothetical protein